MNKTIFLLIICFTTLNIYPQGQVYTITNKKAIKNYETALDAYDKYQFIKALEWLNKATNIQPGFVEAWLLKADIFNKMGDIKNEIYCLTEVTSRQPGYFPLAFFNLAKAETVTGDYEKAYEHAKKLTELLKDDTKNAVLVEDLLNRTGKALDLYQHPLQVEILNCGAEINSQNDDYWPSISADDETLIWTVKLPVEKSGRLVMQEDFFISYKSDGNWSLRKPLGKPVNTDDNEGAICLSADGRSCYFTVCNRADGFGRCDIYKSVLNGNLWSVPENAGNIINSEANEKQPSLSADGKMLFFSSDRKGGFGKMDIWYVLKDTAGNWQKPVNAGDSVNTPEDEQSPFIHFDNRTLYFSSDGHYGLGKSDIYKCTMTSVGLFSKPVNLGYPINTNNEEVGLIINARGSTAYYSAIKPDGFGGLDLYHFQLPQQIQPASVMYVKGQVSDSRSHVPLEAMISVTRLDNPAISASTLSDMHSGFYLLCLESGYDYALHAEKEQYLFYSGFFSLSATDSAKDYILNISLNPIMKEGKIILNNIFFEFASAKLKPESFDELEKIYRLLMKNSEIQVEIAGHTDNTGDREFNIKLSKDRAKSVYDYLVQKGIDKGRLSFKGYADSRPVADNSTAAGRSMNRRTEIVVK